MVNKAMPGIGGAPTRATTLPDNGGERKTYPVASGFTDYFPDAIVAVAHVSHHGNEQHNPGQPLHWARGKASDEADTLMRHFLQRGLLDTDGQRHSAKLAWRALSLLQKEIEAEKAQTPVPFQKVNEILSSNEIRAKERLSAVGFNLGHPCPECDRFTYRRYVGGANCKSGYHAAFEAAKKAA